MTERTEKDLSPRAVQILDAADELFAARGYAGVSIRDIAGRAGVKKALVFYYFHSKAALFEQVLNRYYAAHAAALAEPTGERLSPRERLHVLVDSYIDFIEDHRHYVQLVQRELSAGSEFLDQVRRGIRALYDRVTDILRDLLPDRGPLAAEQFFVSFSGLVNTYYTYGSVLGELWEGDPMSATNRRLRREHLHWIVDALVDKLSA